MKNYINCTKLEEIIVFCKNNKNVEIFKGHFLVSKDDLVELKKVICSSQLLMDFKKNSEDKSFIIHLDEQPYKNTEQVLISLEMGRDITLIEEFLKLDEGSLQ